MAKPNTRRTQQSKHRRKKKSLPLKAGVIPLIVLLSAFIVVMVVLAPKEPSREVAVSVSGSTLVESSGVVYTKDIRVTEIMSSNKTALPDENGNYPDWIELTNTGTGTVNLSGYGLSDRSDKIRFTFPEHTLGPGERVIIFASDTTQNVAGKTLHAKFKISSKGDIVYLFGPDGVAYETVEVPAMDRDMVYALSGDQWVVTALYSPGYENTQVGYETFLREREVTPGVLMINEVLASNVTTLVDEDGEYSDWIELYNSGSTPFDISGFGLSDDPGNPLKWRFADGTTVPANGYLIVFASKKDRPGNPSVPSAPHTNFGLAAEGEAVVLSDSLGRLIDRADYDNLRPDTSWGRKETEDRGWALFLTPTPGMPNNKTSEIYMDDQMIARNESGVIITEVLLSNTQYANKDGKFCDYIELYNQGNKAVNLSGYGLSDRLNHPRKWQFPDVTIQPHSYLLVYCNGENKYNAESEMIYTSFSLSLTGETVVFSDSSGKILDKVLVPQLVADVTYGRTVGQSGLFYYATPTPGEQNGEQFHGFAETPSFETQGGIFSNVIDVTVNVPEGCQVRYTIDGSDPGYDSMLYTEPIHIPNTSVVRIRSFQDDLYPSQISTQTYFISVYHSLPIFSLVTDPWNVWNEDTGMLADGPNLNRDEQGTPWFQKYATYGKKIHYDGHIEMYDTDGTQLISQGMSFHVMGQYSLDMPQKSWAINATARYSPGRFNVALFDDRPYDSYKNIVLRNGGQDGQYTRVLDGLQARIAEQAPDTTVITQAWRPVIVFLNGSYWGHYNLRERVNRHFVAQHEGWEDPDAMDLLEADGIYPSNIRWGSNTEYKELVNFVKENDMTLDENLEYVAARVDIDNMFDYFIFEMYYGNTDPGNIRFYKQHGADGKWRWILYDLDWGLFDSAVGGPSYVLNEDGMGRQKINNTLIRGVLQHPQMQDKFLRRLGELFQTIFTPENIIAEFESMIAEVQQELPTHYMRWAEEMHPKISFDVPKNSEGAYNYWLSRVERFYNVVNKRPNIFWGMVQECFQLTDAQMQDYMGPRPALPEEPK